MHWALLAVAALLLAGAIRAWQLWGRPWRDVATQVGRLARGEQPSTFLVRGGAQPRRIGLALEDLFREQADLKRRAAERASGANAVFEALSDGLLIVNERREIRFINPSFRNLFPASDPEI